MTTEFLLTSLVVILVPGAGVLYTVSSGLFYGRRSSVIAATGCTFGILPHLAASFLGLSALLHMSAEAFQFLKILGVLYLLYLAWGLWRNTGTLKFEAPGGSPNGWKLAVRGTLVNSLNPKLTLFFFAFMPQFITRGPSANAQMLQLSGIFMAMTLFVFVIYGLLAGKLHDRVAGSPHIMKRFQRGFAGIFALVAVRLAFQER